ncbi:hypothetical protein [Nocardia callitridis]|uniref:Uncharacterized protein n=1 Tax=Nocardia callitridis TaxID=648753 RepID=A0ABP9KV26_9NOCA
MDQTVRIGGQPYRVIGKARLAVASRACYGKHRFTLQRVSDGSLWTAFGARLSPASQMLKCGSARVR